MKILIEGANYPITTLQNIFDDAKFYNQKNSEGTGTVTSVGYYHSFEKNELIYMLPKVFMVDDDTSVFGKTKDELLELNSINNIKHKSQFNWIRQSSLYFYKSLREYQKRKSDSKIVNETERLELNTNLGEQEYSYLDLVLSFFSFYNKNKNFILYKRIEFNSMHVKRPKWEKTIRKSLPILDSSNSPIYLKIKNKKKNIDTEEQLLIYFFSILENFNQDHNWGLRIDKSFKIIRGDSFTALQDNGLSRLKKIKYRYFNDTLKRMYSLCEIYFSQTDKSSLKTKKEDFLSVNNYNLVFEDMIEKLLSEELLDRKVNGVSLDDLKKNDDGKIIDHIYKDDSLFDTSSIYYIGDSKYYKPTTKAGKLSKYKQFTYAKNVIQFNIDMLNENVEKDKLKIRYRDNLTEGYDITPNFFIYGFINNKENFDEHLIEKREKLPVKSYHYKERLFDRDTLFIHQYKINFLFVLKSYSNFNKIKNIKFREEVKRDFRKNFIDFFNDSKICEFEFYKYTSTSLEECESFVLKNFKDLNGRCYQNMKSELILARHIEAKIDDSIMKFFGPMEKLK